MFHAVCRGFFCLFLFCFFSRVFFLPKFLLCALSMSHNVLFLTELDIELYGLLFPFFVDYICKLCHKPNLMRKQMMLVWYYVTFVQKSDFFSLLSRSDATFYTATPWSTMGLLYVLWKFAVKLRVFFNQEAIFTFNFDCAEAQRSDSEPNPGRHLRNLFSRLNTRS